MSKTEVRISGLIPDQLKVRSARIILDSLAIELDVGFHDFEIGAPQRLLVGVEIWLEDVAAPAEDNPASAWNYDVIRQLVENIAKDGRFNLQETFAHRLFERLAAHRGVNALRVRTMKPDIYASANGVGIEIASFKGSWPDS